MKILENQKAKIRGLTLIEFLVYTAVVGIFIVLILSIVNSFFKSRNTVRKLSLLENSLAYVFNDFTQEIHWSDDAEIAPDTFNTLTLNQTETANGESQVEVKYEVAGGQLLKNNKPITPPSGEVAITAFKVKNVAPAGKIKCLEITLELEHSGADPKIISENKTTISLRKTKFQTGEE